MMKTVKKFIRTILLFAATLSLFSCNGNFAAVSLKDAVELSGEGEIGKEIVAQIKNENAIATFKGTCGDLKYEWTLFGSAMEEIKSVKLGVNAEKSEDGQLFVRLLQNENFGFFATLSLRLNEKWEAQSATAYADGNAFATVSVTGSENTILNVSLDGSISSFVIKADEETADDTAKTEEKKETEESGGTEEKAEPSQTEPSRNNTSSDTAKETPSSTPPKTEATPTTTTKKPENSGKDKYFTDPVPEGKPNPVEPEDQEIDKEITYTCTFSIECSTILNNLDMLDPNKLEAVPHDGVILKKTTVTFFEGESVFDVLQRVCKEMGIHMEASWTPMYNSAYVEGICNLYEFDCGALSGWMYKVNGWYPNYGSSRYQLQEGDVVEWRYTCDLGNDIGGGYAIGG